MEISFSCNIILFFLLWTAPSISDRIQADWSVYKNVSDSNISESLEIVKNLPIHTYWDYEKGSYRTSIIGDLIKSDFPHLVTTQKKQIGNDSGSKRIQLINVTVVDAPVVFMHSMLVVQHLAKQAFQYQKTLAALHAEKYDFGLKILRIANQTGTEWRTASEIRAVTNVINIKIENRKKKMKLLKKKLETDLELLRIKYEGKRKLLEEHHANMIAARANQFARYEVLDNATRLEKRRLVQLSEQERAATQLKVLLSRQEEETAKLNLEMNLSLAALRFRYTEESAVERENEDVMRHIMTAKAENLRKSFETIVTSVRDIISQFINNCMARPWDVLAAAGIVLSLLFTYIVCIEVTKALKMYVIHLLFPHRSVRDAKRGPKTSRNSLEITPKAVVTPSGVSDMVFSASNGKKLQEVCDIYCLCARSASHISIPLPNVLLVGPSGTGKTIAAEAIAKDSGLPYVTLLGADILAASSKLSFGSSTGPGGILRDTLESAVRANRGRGFIVILDEADAVIADRGRSRRLRSQGDGREAAGGTQGADDRGDSAVECIHILLHRLRVGSCALGVLITTNMQLQEVDPALLDRMDMVVCLDVPRADLRLQCLVKYALDSLAPYMEKEPNEDLQRLLCFFQKMKSEDGGEVSALDDCSPINFAKFLEGVLNKKVNARDMVSEGNPVFSSESAESEDKKVAATPKRRGRPKKSTATEEEEDGETKEVVEEKELTTLSSGSADDNNHSFNLYVCLHEFMRRSHGWSYREIEKIVQNILLEVLSTEGCKLTTSLWIRQIHYKSSKGKENVPVPSPLKVEVESVAPTPRRTDRRKKPSSK